MRWAAPAAELRSCLLLPAPIAERHMSQEWRASRAAGAAGRTGALLPILLLSAVPLPRWAWGRPHSPSAFWHIRSSMAASADPSWVGNGFPDSSTVRLVALRYGRPASHAMRANLPPSRSPSFLPSPVIAPLTTLGHWQREIETWTDMNCVVYAGSQADRECIKASRNKQAHCCPLLSK